jgi:hypothetical protein
MKVCTKFDIYVFIDDNWNHNATKCKPPCLGDVLFVC